MSPASEKLISKLDITSEPLNAEMAIKREVKWVQVDGDWTRYSVMGDDLSEESLDINNKGEDENRVVLLMMPGNPGHEGMYEDFGRKLLVSLNNRQMAVDEKDRLNYIFYTVSYLNHVPVPKELQKSGKHKPKENFSMEDQIQHKRLFIKENLPKAKEIYIIAHSMGSYITLSLLAELCEEFNIVRIVGLFPALERLAITPYGKIFEYPFHFLKSLDFVLRRAIFFLDHLPSSFKKYCVRLTCTFGEEPIPKVVVAAAAEILNADILFNMLHLAIGEMSTVKRFDDSLLAVKEKIFLFYGVEDGWVPLEYGLEMKERLPEGQVLIDEKKCGHGFILKDAEKIVDILMDLIK